MVACDWVGMTHHGPTLFTAHCTRHTAHCTTQNAHCTLHNAHCTLHTDLCTLHTAHCTLQTANCHCTLYTTHSKLYTVYSNQYLSTQNFNPSARRVHAFRLGLLLRVFHITTHYTTLQESRWVSSDTICSGNNKFRKLLWYVKIVIFDFVILKKL